MKIFLLTLAIIAICLILLAVRLFFGKQFVSSHIDQNKALRKKGIGCVQSMDTRMRLPNRCRVSERSGRTFRNNKIKTQ